MPSVLTLVLGVVSSHLYKMSMIIRWRAIWDVHWRKKYLSPVKKWKETFYKCFFAFFHFLKIRECLRQKKLIFHVSFFVFVFVTIMMKFVSMKNNAQYHIIKPFLMAAYNAFSHQRTVYVYNPVLNNFKQSHMRLIVDKNQRIIKVKVIF